MLIRSYDAENSVRMIMQATLLTLRLFRKLFSVLRLRRVNSCVSINLQNTLKFGMPRKNHIISNQRCGGNFDLTTTTSFRCMFANKQYFTHTAAVMRSFKRAVDSLHA